MNETSRHPLDQHKVALIGILLLTAFLGLYHLGHESLWNDELATWVHITQPSVAEAVTVGAIDSMWPAFNGSLYLFTKLAGDSEFAMRFPSVLATVIAVSLLYALGRYLYSARTGLIGAAIMSVSWSQVSNSQEARTYAVEVAIMILITWLWLRLLADIERGRSRTWKTALALFTTSSVAIYLHLMGLLILGIQGITALIVCGLRQRGFRLVFGLYAGLAIFSIPILLTLGLVTSMAHIWIAPPADLFMALVDHLKYAFSNDVPLIAGLGIVALVSLVYGLVSHKGNQAQDLPGNLPLPPTWTLVVWYAVPFLIFYTYSVLVRSIMVERYLVFAQPPIYLLAGYAIARFPAWRSLRTLGAVAVVGVLLFDLFDRNHYYSEFQKPDFRRMVTDTVSESSRSEKMVILGMRWPTYTAYQYYRRQVASPTPEVVIGIGGARQQMVRAVKRASADDVWVIMVAERGFDTQFLLDKGYQPVERRDFPIDYSATLWRKIAP